MKRLLLFALIYGALLPAGVRAEQALLGRIESLGPKLAYLLPAADAAGLQLLQNRAAGDSIILDLRGATTDAREESWLAALSARSVSGSITIILISRHTPIALRNALRTGVKGCLTIAAKADEVFPDIVVETPVEADEQSAEALRTGTATEKLITSVLEKRRYDEASVVRQHTTGREESPEEDDETIPAGESPTTPEISKTKPASEKPAAAKPVVDAVLQRAVHVYRGLVVLKKTT